MVLSSRSLAIGKNGHNIKLATMLTGYEIDVYRDTEMIYEDAAEEGLVGARNGNLGVVVLIVDIGNDGAHRNENIDVINYTSNPSLFIQRALSPARISTIRLDEEAKKVLIFVFAIYCVGPFSKCGVTGSG